MLELDFQTGKHWLRLAFTATLGIAAACATPAYATGTVAGTTISNTATITYTGPGGPVSVPSNTVSLRVDEVLNVTVTSGEAGDVVVQPGATNQVVRFKVTNTGNGSEAFRLPHYRDRRGPIRPHGNLDGDRYQRQRCLRLRRRCGL